MLLTVITVCFNEEKNIARTLDSVLNQTLSDFEYIICDGKSSDRTLEIIESYREKFIQKGVDFKVYSEKDGGVYYGMNNAIDRATGEYAVFMNGGDNFATNDVLYKVSEFIKNAAIKPDVLYGDYNYIVGRKCWVLSGSHERLVHGMSINHQSSFASLTSLKKHRFNTSLQIVADYNFMLDVYSDGGIFMYVPVVIADFYAGGISSLKPHTTMLEERKVCKAHNIKWPLRVYIRRIINISKGPILRTGLALLRAIAKAVPKDKNIWLFGAWDGEQYSDNPKYLFEYVNKANNNKKCIWISKNDEVVKHIKKLGYRAYKELSFKGLYYAARGHVAFCTENVKDVSRILTSKTKYVTSETLRMTGQPKNDAFINITDSPYIDEIKKRVNPDVKILAYLPTHRNFGRNYGVPYEMSMETLNEINKKLKEKNIIMIFKPHFYELRKYENYKDNLSNIIFSTDKEFLGDVYTFLPACDMMITDYSRIMFDYLTTDKPIVYFAYDYDSFFNENESVTYDFNGATYGPVCKTWDEVIDAASTITADGYKELREKQREKYCPFNDGKNCERAYNMACKM